MRFSRVARKSWSKQTLREMCKLGIGESKYNWSLMRDAIKAFVNKDISSFYRRVYCIIQLLIYLVKVEGRYNGKYRFFFFRLIRWRKLKRSYPSSHLQLQTRENTGFERLPIHRHERLFRGDHFRNRGGFGEFDVRPCNSGFRYDHRSDLSLDDRDAGVAVPSPADEHFGRREGRPRRAKSRFEDRMQHEEIRDRR